MTFWPAFGGNTLLKGHTDPEDDPFTIYRLGTTASPPIIDWGANGGVEVLTYGAFKVRVQADGTIEFDDQGVTAPNPVLGASLQIGTLYYTMIDSSAAPGFVPQESAVKSRLLTLTASAAPSLTPPLYSMDENTPQGTDLFTFTYLNATTPTAVSLSNVVPANCVQMKADGVTVQAGSATMDAETVEAMTFSASFSDANGGPYSVNVSVPINDIDETSGVMAFADGDVVRGQSTTINPPASLTTGSGTYSATGLPRGLTVNSANGIISGIPFWWGPRATVTLTRGVGVATAQIGVTVKSGIYAPEKFAWNFDPALLGAATTDVTVSTSTALIAAIKTAVDDQGSLATGNKYHIVRYDGPDITSPLSNSDATVAPAGRDYTFVHVIANNRQLMRQLNFSYKAAIIRWENWIIPGDILAASNQYCVRSSNALHNFFKCDFGPFFSGEGFTPLTIQVGPFRTNNNQPYVFEACRVGGWSFGPAGAGAGSTSFTSLYMIDVHSFFNGNDYCALYGAGDVAAWIVGGLTYYKRSPSNALHADDLQSGAQKNAGFIEKAVMCDRISLAGDPRYGSSGVRIGWDAGFTGNSKVRCKNVIEGISGWDGMVMRSDDIELDGYMVLPAPGCPSEESRITLGAPGATTNRAKIANIWCSSLSKNVGWGANPPIAGEQHYYTNTNSASIAAKFPNLSGIQRPHSRLSGSTYVTRTTFEPDEPVGVVMHPVALRAWVSEKFRPHIGWGPWFKDPVQYGVHDAAFGSVPSYVAPVVTGLSVSAGTMSFTLDATDGYYFWLVDQRPGNPSYANLLVGVQDNGATGSDPGNTVGSKWGYGISNSAGVKTVAIPSLTAGQNYTARMFMLNRTTGAWSSIMTYAFTA